MNAQLVKNSGHSVLLQNEQNFWIKKLRNFQMKGQGTLLFNVVCE